MSCLDCPKLGYCAEGAAGPSSCPDGTYGHTTGLRSAEDCAACPVGGYCVSSAFFPCSTGLFNPTPDAFDASACKSCVAHFNVAHLTTTSTGASDPAQCICAVDYYDDAASGEARSCVACDEATMLCTRSGLTLTTVPLRPSRWRHSNRTTDIHACVSASNTSACLGGSWVGQCTDGQGGPMCKVCLRSGEYFDDADGFCRQCPEARDTTARVASIVAVVVAVIPLARFVFLFPERIPSAIWPVRYIIMRFKSWLGAVRLQAKLKVRAGQFALPREAFAPTPIHCPNGICAVPLRRSSWPSTK